MDLMGYETFGRDGSHESSEDTYAIQVSIYCSAADSVGCVALSLYTMTLCTDVLHWCPCHGD